MGREFRNSLGVEAILRECGRGEMLDKHRGETGLRVRLEPGQQKDLLQLSSENRADPVVVTVGIDALLEDEDNEAEAMSLQTVLSWGTGKGVSSAIIDTRVGAQVVLVANILNVAVRYPDPSPLGSQGDVYLVSASVAYGDRPGSANPALTFTTRQQAIADGATGTVEQIPKYAVAVAWMSSDDPTAAAPPAAVLEFIGTRTGAIVAQIAPAPGVFVPIPNFSYFVRARNISGSGASESYRLVFEVVL